jgi:transcriptional regulator with XRE-family HTH domain
VPNLSKHRQSPALVALGSAIKRIRLAQNMSQEELSLAAEVDLSYVGRVERGDNNVAILTLQKIATALEVTLTELMAESEL